ncbi:hypothetical protein [Natronomonas gomsonensis]|uniref:DUF7560 family zinc ribbon protein n=1 Tax=Natronomonas gomsonensis TaxID=1046043 RepID=UPI0015B8917C|nr:hypothetical protein [Natronomonas gomsonensis]
MSPDEGSRYAFVCPGCAESIAVDESMRNVLLERGCVICETTVTTAAFRRIRSIDTREL